MSNRWRRQSSCGGELGRVVQMAMVMVTLAWCAGLARAQTLAELSWAHSATLEGLVVDQTGAVVPDASLTALNVHTGTERSGTSRADGRFLMPLLPPGTYVVTARRPGFAPLEVRDVRLAANDHILLRIQLRVGVLAQSVTVTAPRSLFAPDETIVAASPGRPGEGIRIGGDLLRQLGDTYESLFQVVPAAVSGSYGISVHGVAASSNLLLVDGVDLTSSHESAVRLHLGAEAIEDIEVVTAGVLASHPLAQGAVVNLRTRSGTNRVQGVLAARFSDFGWNGFEWATAATSHDQRMIQVDAAIGGPVRRDRAWFFASYRHERTESEPLDPGATYRALLDGLRPGWLATGNRSLGHLAFGKGSIRLGARHDLEVFYHRDRVDSETATYEGPRPRHYTGGTAVGGRWTSVWSGTLMSHASLAFNDKAQGQVAAPTAGATILVYDHLTYDAQGLPRGVQQAIGLNRAAFCCRDWPARKLTLEAGLTWFGRSRLGDHEIGLGVWIQSWARVEAAAAWGNDGFLTEEVVLVDPSSPGAGSRPFHRIVYGVNDVRGATYTVSDQAVYVQDRWRLTDRLTVTVGARLDRLQDTYRTTQITERRLWLFGPRVSVVARPSAADTVSLGWGRVHESGAGSRRLLTPATSSVADEAWDRDLDGVFETRREGRWASALPTGTTEIDSPQPHVDEMAVGYRRQFPGRLVLEVSGVRRTYWNALFQGQSAPILQNGVFQGWDSAPAVTPWQVNVWSRPVVTDLTVQATRLTPRFQVLASYTRSWRHLEGTWAPFEIGAFVQPEAFPNDKGPMQLGPDLLSTSPLALASAIEAAELSTPSTEPCIDHVGRVAVGWIGPRGLTVSAVYRVQSGLWSGPILTRTATSDPRFGPPVVNGQTNPFATTLRYAYATRGDGQLRLPVRHDLAIRFGYRLPARAGRVEPAVELVNPFNWDAPTRFLPRGADMTSPDYGRTYLPQAPRSVRLAMRWTF